MKLRNKKTGEIKEYTHTMTSYHVPIKGGYEIFTPWKPEEWEELEDVKEPLIKDERIRRAVRAWAEANNLMNNKLQIVPLKPSDGAYNDSGIICNGSVLMSITLIHGIGRGLRDSKKQYTIAELCGEEE